MIDLLEPVLNEIYQDDKMLLHFSLWLSDQVENSSIITLIGLDMNTAILENIKYIKNNH